MTEERIGGISISLGGSLAELEAVLDAADKRLAAFTQKYGNVNVNVSGTTKGTTRGGGPTANEQLVHAINALTEQLQQTKFGGGGGRVPARDSQWDAAIANAERRGMLTVTGRMSGETRDMGINRQPSEALRPVQANIREMRVTSSQPIDMPGLTELNKQFEAMAQFLGGMTDGLSNLAAAMATPTSMPAASAGGGASSRRAPRYPRGGSPLYSEQAGPPNPYGVVYSASSAEPPQPMRAPSSTLTPHDKAFAKAIGAQLDEKKIPRNEMDRRAEYPPAPQMATRAAITPDNVPFGGYRSEEERQRVEGGTAAAIMHAESVAPSSTSYESPADKKAREKKERDRARQKAREDRENDRAAEAKAQENDRRTRARRSMGLPEEGTFGFGRSDSEIFGTQSMLKIIGAQGAFSLREASLGRAQEKGAIAREADTLLQGRTSRTGASSLLGYVFGGRRGLTQAQTRLGLTEREEQSAKTYQNTLDTIIRKQAFQIEISKDGGEEAARTWESQARDSTVYRKAVEDVAKAEVARRDALKDVEKYTQGALPAARNLFAITAGGAAFGLGLEAVNKFQEAAVPAIAKFIDIQTGLGATSTKVTESLAQQTLAFKGNSQAALAAAEAQAGLDATTSALLDSYLALPTQIKAGTQAMQQSAALFQAAYGVSNAQSGLFGGYGGVLGSGLLGQQLGGGMGFSEQIAQNVDAFRKPGAGTLPSSIINTGLSFLTNGQTRQYMLNQMLGTQGGNAVNDALGYAVGGLPVVGGAAQSLGVLQPAQKQPLDLKSLSLMVGYAISLNQDTTRGAKALGKTADTMYSFTQNADLMQQAATTAAQAGDWSGVQSAMQGFVMFSAKTGKVVTDVTQYAQGLQNAAVGAGIQSPDQMAQQSLALERLRETEAAASVPAIQARQQYEMPAFLNQTQRSSTLALQQNAASAYIENLANPPTPVGTGIRFAKGDQKSAQDGVNQSLRQTQQIQTGLNALYASGEQTIRDTYDPGVLQVFGQQGVQVFNGLIGQAKTVGTQIAAIEATVSNEQAQFQADQYTNDLRIAKRSLTDIQQLTGQIGAANGDNLGLYERQNLLLGRQSQQLQFMLSQRQINFQVAVAGFQVPGLTPAEQNARVQEAKTEASFAQKQLDIQKQMFGNQVKIVDIGNLRQATDLIHQIGLLQEGRKVTLDTAAAQQQLQRLGKAQAAIQADLKTYMDAAIGYQSKLIANTADQEAAAGRTVAALGDASASAAYKVWSAIYAAITGQPYPGGSSASAGFSKTAPVRGSNSSPTKHAAGALFNTTGSTSMVVGEAGTETVAVLRNPREVSGGIGSGGGGDIVINLTATLDGAVIYRDTIRRMGRDASLRGLRAPN